MKSILCDAQLLTTHTLSAKMPNTKLWFELSVLDGLILPTEVKIVGSTHLCYREVFFTITYNTNITYTTKNSYNTNINYNTYITYNTNITYATTDITYNDHYLHYDYY